MNNKLLEWESVINTDLQKNWPDSRNAHVVFTYNNEMYMYGGRTGSSRPNDLWCFNFGSKEWRLIEKESERGPKSRSGRTGIVVGDEFYLFGGVDVKSAPTNLLDKYNLIDHMWTELEPTGDLPPPAHSATTWYYKGNIFLFGGLTKQIKITDGAECLKDFYKYNIKNNEWQKIQLNGNPPIPVFGCSSVLRENKAYIYGGSQTDDSNYNQFHVFDCDTMTWDKINVEENVGVIPPKVSGHCSLLIHEDYMVVLCGWSDGGCTSESYVFNFLKNEWTRLEIEGELEKRDSCRGVFYQNQIYLFAGWNGFSRIGSMNSVNLKSLFLRRKWSPQTHKFYPETFKNVVLFLHLIQKRKNSALFNLPKVLLRHMIKFIF